MITQMKIIHSGGQMIDTCIEPSETPLRLSERDRYILDSVSNATQVVCKASMTLMDKAVSATMLGLSSLSQSQTEQTHDPVSQASRHFGVSTFRAAAHVVGGAAVATNAIMSFSRDSIVHIIHKKYGEDAGYIAEKTIGSAINAVDTICFDTSGIARHIFASVSIESVFILVEGQGYS
ncbi:senescence-associated protein-domain-containing protein [Spinellus fusiger]|nr:senescence-associated protein-domain-containing protein [Spinellus fusiger]